MRIANAEDRQHVARRRRWIRLELAPDVLDVRVDGALVGIEGLTVDGVEQLTAGEDPAGVARQRGQECRTRWR